MKKERQPASVVSEPRYEIVQSSRTKLEESPKKFVMPENTKEIDPYAEHTLRDLSEVQHVADRQLVNVLGKVVDVAHLSKVTHASSSKNKMSLWPTARLQCGSCYGRRASVCFSCTRHTT